MDLKSSYIDVQRWEELATKIICFMNDYGYRVDMLGLCMVRFSKLLGLDMIRVS